MPRYLVLILGCCSTAVALLHRGAPQPSQGKKNSSLVRLLKADGQADGQTEAHAQASLRVRSGIEQLEAWKDSGKAVHSALSDLEALVAPISKASYGQELAEFVNVAKSRFVADPGNEQAATFLHQRLQALGFTLREQPVTVKSAYTAAGHPKRGNVIAYLRGEGPAANEVVVFGAHYDSVNWADIKGLAPGADDNGSGVAGLLQIAKVLATAHGQHKLRRSVLLVAFQAEELGLLGSKAFVAELLKKGEFGTPVAAIIADEICFKGHQFHHKAIFETKGKNPQNVAMVDTFAHQAMAEASAKGVLNGFEVNYHGFGSDHVPFLDAGYPAVLLIERDNMYYADHFGHTKKDALVETDPEFGAAMTRLAARVMLVYAA